jgi:2-amino-4-hydroxy-6-hydroxymethyldihydropteridine diphosphokinase
MSNAVLSIGSNEGDREAHLAAAVQQLRRWLTAVSPVYQTPPWGPVPQPDYLNAVLLVEDPAAAPADWLARAQSAELRAGRTRDVRWGPRTLDVDVIAVDDTTSTDSQLLLPHPRAAERAFVLVPWLDVDPDARLGGTRVVELVEALPPAEVAAVRRCDRVVL